MQNRNSYSNLVTKCKVQDNYWNDSDSYAIFILMFFFSLPPLLFFYQSRSRFDWLKRGKRFWSVKSIFKKIKKN